MSVRAPAKLNLCLYVGRPREDGLHELRSLFCPLTLADVITVSPAERDEVVCPGVDGPNLATEALAGLRRLGWAEPPVRVQIEKRIPVAAGLGGGSADAGAVLRLGAGNVEGLEQLALELGADVPSQVRPGFALVGGAGENISPLPAPAEFGVVAVPGEVGLRAGEVYAEFDRLGGGRGDAELADLEAALAEAAVPGRSPLEYRDLLVNDLEEAARSLRPDISEALAALDRAGAEHAIVAGSGPTAIGLCADLVAADAVAAALPPRYAGAVVAAAEVGS
jgi:4-diphosphocytidyl-2-C-methyl-D-erythritol kinase